NGSGVFSGLNQGYAGGDRNLRQRLGDELGRDGQRYDRDDQLREQQQQREQRPLTPDQIETLSKSIRDGQGNVDPTLLDAVRQRQATIYVTIVRRNNMIVVRSSDARALEEIGRVIKSLDVPCPQVLLEVRILNLDLNDDFESAFDFDYAGAKSSLSLT